MDRGRSRIIPAVAALVRDRRCWPRRAGGRTRRRPPPRVRADIVLPVETQTIEAVVPRQATLETILRQHELPAPLVQAAIESTRTVFNPRHLRAERPYRLVLSIDGLLKEFEYQIDADRFLRIVNRDRSDAREARRRSPVCYDKETSVVTIRGRIDREHSSLIAAVDATGERVQLAISLAELFSGQIDFENDLQPGDSFEVLFETTKYDGAVRRLRIDPRRAVHQRAAKSTRPIAGCIRGRRRPATTTSRDARCGGSCSRRRCGSHRA